MVPRQRRGLRLHRESLDGRLVLHIEPRSQSKQRFKGRFEAETLLEVVLSIYIPHLSRLTSRIARPQGLMSPDPLGALDAGVKTVA